MKTVGKLKMPLRAALCVVFCLLSMVLVAGPAFAEEAANGHHEKEHENANDIGVFLGGANHKAENGFAVGLDYEHRLNSILGAGALVEYTAGDFDSWVVAASLYIHPYKGFRVVLAPGFENREKETNFLFRTGLAYQFEIGKNLSISPEYNVDFVHGETTHVYGVSFGFAF